MSCQVTRYAVLFEVVEQARTLDRATVPCRTAVQSEEARAFHWHTALSSAKVLFDFFPDALQPA